MRVMKTKIPVACETCGDPFHALVVVGETEYGEGYQCWACVQRHAETLLALSRAASKLERSHGVDW
jgi:hypothetical protein